MISSEFYEDLFEELRKYGEIESLDICDNLAHHKVALEKGKEPGLEEYPQPNNKEVPSAENGTSRSEVNESVACSMSKMSVSENSTAVTPLDTTESSNIGVNEPDLDEKIQALKKKDTQLPCSR